MKKIGILILLLLLILTGCGKKNNSNIETKKKLEDKVSKKDNYDNHSYDGIYSFLYSVDNGSGNMYTQKGYLKIDNDKCATIDSTSISDKYSFELKTEGICKIEKDIYKVKLIKPKIDSESLYECKIEGKNLNCESKSEYGISGCVEENLEFKYFGTFEEYKEYKSKKNYYLGDDIRWGMSAQEVINVIGSGEESSAPNFNKNLSWIKIYPENYGSLSNKIDEYTYLFYDSQLIAYQYTFDNEISSPYNLYEQIKNILIEKYGNPKVENYNWSDETYKNDKSNYNNALKYKDVTIETKWDFGEHELVMTWNYGDILRVAFVKNGYFKNL